MALNTTLTFLVQEIYSRLCYSNCEGQRSESMLSYDFAKKLKYQRN